MLTDMAFVLPCDPLRWSGTDRQRMGDLLGKLRDAAYITADRAGKLQELVRRNQNAGCGGDLTMSEAEWTAARDAARAGLTFAQELDRILAPFLPRPNAGGGKQVVTFDVGRAEREFAAAVSVGARNEAK